MITSYKILCAINISHTYFEVGVANGMTLKPDRLTDQILKKYRFKLNESINNLMLYSVSDQSIGNQLGYIESVTGQDHFTLDIYSSTQAFYVYTELPEKWKGTIQYNSGDSEKTEGSKGMTLIPDYELTTQSAIVGQVKIYFSDLIRESETQSAIIYNIHFTARKTQWNYYVVNKSPQKMNEPFIKVDGEVTFNSAQPVTLITGEKALLISSGDNYIPMRFRSDQKYDLFDYSGHSGLSQDTSKREKKILSGLPIASPAGTIPVVKDGQHIFTSVIYVYI